VELICLELEALLCELFWPLGSFFCFFLIGIFFHIEPTSLPLRISWISSEAKLLLADHHFRIPFTPLKLKSWKMLTECGKYQIRKKTVN